MDELPADAEVTVDFARISPGDAMSDRTDSAEGSVQSFSHIWFGLSGARQWLKR
jgi:hypothetical protein